MYLESSAVKQFARSSNVGQQKRSKRVGQQREAVEYARWDKCDATQRNIGRAVNLLEWVQVEW